MQTVNIELFRDAVAFTMTLKKWGNRRQGDMRQIETDSDKSRLKLSKQLIVSPELEAIASFQAELYKWCTGRSVPSFFKDGLYLVRLSMVEEFEAKLNAAKSEMGALVEGFQSAFPAQVDAARIALNGQFNEKDYPNVSDLPEKFDIAWNWIAFGVPENLPAELRAAEAAKIEAQFRDAETEIMAALREGFAEIISHVTDRLAVQPGEKQKIFRDSLFENLAEFIGTFNARNLVNDTQLAGLVDQAQWILAQVRGNDPKTQAQLVRDSMHLRQTTAQQFAALREAISQTVIDRPNRRFELE